MPYKNKEKKKTYQKEYYKNNKEKINENYKNNSEKFKNYAKQHRKDNPEKVKERIKQWRENNPEYIREYNKQWRKNNRERIKEYRKQWKKENPEYYKQYDNHRRKTDLKCNLNHRMSTAIQISLKGNKVGRHWEGLVDYTVIDLKRRLKETMPRGYNWQDFIQGELHIDHIIPIDAFNFTRPEHTDFKRCWALSNLRLLPAQENLIKSNNLIRPFQPALAI